MPQKEIQMIAGASTIYVHDHMSEPPLRDLLADYIEKGTVEYVFWNRTWENYAYTLHENPQVNVMNTCASVCGGCVGRMCSH